MVSWGQVRFRQLETQVQAVIGKRKCLEGGQIVVRFRLAERVGQLGLLVNILIVFVVIRCFFRLFVDFFCFDVIGVYCFFNRQNSVWIQLLGRLGFLDFCVLQLNRFLVGNCRIEVIVVRWVGRRVWERWLCKGFVVSVSTSLGNVRLWLKFFILRLMRFSWGGIRLNLLLGGE